MKIKSFLMMAVLATVVFCSAGFANAQATDNSALIAQLQAQIAQLLAQIQELQQAQQSAGDTAWCHNFGVNLGFAQSGSAEVPNLHKALQKEGISYGGDAESVYSHGTVLAVQRFQQKYGITPFSGYTGLKTRAKLNALYGCANSPVSDVGVPAINPTITLLAPIEGETWPTGSRQDILWSSVGIGAGESVKIDLYKINGNVGPQFNQHIITKLNSGIHEWTVPTTLTAGNTYSVHISKAGDSSIYYQGPVFTIGSSVLPPDSSITVLYPNGGLGAHLTLGVSTMNIRWSAPGMGSSPLRVDFYKKGEQIKKIGEWPASYNNGVVSYHMPTDLPTGNDYKVRVSSVYNPLVYDESDADITVSGQSTYSQITMTSPKEGETWEIGKAYNITWDTRGIPADAKIYIDISNPYLGNPIGRIADAVLASAKSYRWVVPSSIGGNQLGGRYRLTMGWFSPEGYLVRDMSYYYFNIVKPISVGVSCKALQDLVTSSFGGTCGDSLYNKVADLNKDKSVDTADWLEFNPNIGSESWCSAKLNNTFNPCQSAVSIEVKTPNGGETWTAGSNKNITWTSTGLSSSDNVRIDLNKGGVLSNISLSTANDGSFDWFLSSTLSAGSDYKIKISKSNQSFSDESNGNFTITVPSTQPVITVSSPVSGTNWTTGTNQTISWSFQNISSPNVFGVYLYKGTQSRTLGSVLATGGVGSLSFKVPEDLLSGSDYKIKVTKADTPTIFGDSPVISVTALSVTQPTINLISPNGGENWTIGQNQKITWSTNSLIPPTEYLKIDLYKGGIYSRQIINMTPNDGVYDWVPPSILGDGNDYQIKISKISDGSVSDLSSSNFSIKAPASPAPSITVTLPNGGETWAVSDQMVMVTWSSTLSPQDYVRIDLYKGGSPIWNIKAAALNTGVLAFYVFPDWVTGNDYSIRVSKVSDPSIKDDSNANFTINTPAPANPLTLIIPNGNEYWYRGSTQIINWTGGQYVSGVHQNVEIKLHYAQCISSSKGTSMSAYDGTVSCNGAQGAFLTIFRGVADNNSYTWEVGRVTDVPNHLVNGGTYYLEICVGNSVAETKCDRSNFYFSISPGSTALNLNIVGAPSSGNAKVVTSRSGQVTTNYYNSSRVINLAAGDGFLVTGTPVSGYTVSSSGTCSFTTFGGVPAGKSYTCTITYSGTTGGASCTSLRSLIDAHWLSTCSTGVYNKAADVNGDRSVDIIDLSLFQSSANEAWCSEKINTTSNPCAASFNQQLTTLASISDALNLLLQKVMDLVK